MEYWANKGFVASTEGQLGTYAWLVLRSQRYPPLSFDGVRNENPFPFLFVSSQS